MRKTVRNGVPVIGITGEIVPSADAEFYRWFGIDCTCSRDVQRALADSGGSRTVIVEVDSPGGAVTEGAAIYTELMNYPGELQIEITGLAASAASVIAQAKAKKDAKCRISPVALMMVHNVQMSADGDYRDMEKASEVLQVANRAVINAYRLSTGKTEEEIAALLDAETWFSAQEAVDAGLADEIMFVDGAPGALEPAAAGAMKAQARSLINRAPVLPRELIDRLKAEQKAKEDAEETEKARAVLQIERARF